MEREQKLISYRKDINVITFTIDPNDKEYCEVLTKLFNSKREQKDILDLYNYYDSNKISIVINLDDYCENSCEDLEHNKQHLKKWINSMMLDNDINNIKVYESKASIYYIDEYSSKIETEINGEYVDRYYIAE